MKKLIAIVQTSFDGFVASANGSFEHFLGGEENLSFVCGLTDSADAILVGRVSYQLLESAWPTAASKPDATDGMIKYSNWYNRVPKFVLSSTLKSGHSDNTYIINKNFAEEIAQVKQSTGDTDKNIFIFGSPTTLHVLLQQNLLDGFWLIMHPVIFGEGISLFSEMKKVIPLELLSTKHLSNGTIALQYAVNHP